MRKGRKGKCVENRFFVLWKEGGRLCHFIADFAEVLRG